MSLDFQTQEPHLAVVGSAQIVVVGNFADEQGVILDHSYHAFQSTDLSVANVSTTGAVVGVAPGTSILIVTAAGLQAATAVTVGTPTDARDMELYQHGLNVYPPSVSLSSNGGTRQIDIPLRR